MGMFYYDQRLREMLFPRSPLVLTFRNTMTAMFAALESLECAEDTKPVPKWVMLNQPPVSPKKWQR